MGSQIQSPRIGAHVSIEGSLGKAVDRALEKTCESLQIFTRPPRRWQAKPLLEPEINSFIEKSKKANFYDSSIHVPYLPNLASPDDELWKKSIAVIKEELERAHSLKIPYVITHIGSHKKHKDGDSYGIKRVIQAINKLSSCLENYKELMILLENSTAKKVTFGNTFEQINEIIQGVEFSDRIGLAFDTAHAFASGYDISTSEGVKDTFQNISDLMGKEKLKVLHLNDSKGALGSGIDKHEHIGKGKIGIECFRTIMNEPIFFGLPLILETPNNVPNADLLNLNLLRSLKMSKKEK